MRAVLTTLIGAPVALAAAALLLGAPSPAAASEGSVPAAVRAFVTGGGLVDELRARDADLGGIPDAGAALRVFHFTDERVAGDTAGNPTRMANEWAVPLTVADAPAGVAIIWIDTATGVPALAEVQPDAAAAAALAATPAEARLVRDRGGDAWFALSDDLLTPLVSGSSGITEPTPVDEAVLTAPVAPADDDPAGLLDDPQRATQVAIAVAVVVLAAAIAVLTPRIRRPAKV